MKLAIKYIAILCWTLSTFAQAGVAEDISRPVFTDMRFSYDSVALITDNRAYIFSSHAGLAGGVEKGFSGGLKDGIAVGFARPTKGKLGNEFHAVFNKTKTESESLKGYFGGDDVTVLNWVSEHGLKFQAVGGYCGEGVDHHHALFFQLKELNTYLPGCETISELSVIYDFEQKSDELWLGSYEQYEYGDGAGSGVRVISLKSKKLVAAFSPKQKSMDGYVIPLNFDASSGKLMLIEKSAAGRAASGSENARKLIARSKGQLADGYVKFIRTGAGNSSAVWVLTDTALHQISDKKVIGQWHLSEQFNAEGDLTLLASLKPVKSDPWAILLRHTKVLDTKSIWQQLQKSPKLAKRLTYAYDEEGNYFSIDGKQLGAYNTLEYPQDLINRLKTK